MQAYLLTLWPQILHVLPDLVLTGWVTVSVVCRFGKMSKDTSNVVAFQYAALFAGSLCAFGFQFVPELHAYAVTAGLSGVVVFLALSSKRWRRGAPEGTSKELYRLSNDQLRHVVGGSKTP